MNVKTEKSQLKLSWLERLIGGPIRVNLFAVAKSIFVTERSEEMAGLIARITHRKGQIFVADQIFNWRNISDTEDLRITADVSGNQTILEIRANYSTMAFFIFFAVFFSGMFLTAAIGGFAFQPKTGVGIGTIAISGFIISYLISRMIWGNFAEKRINELRMLIECLCDFVDENPNVQEHR
ncbi:MAG: hypothetical protein VX294_04095 [Candidatus Latescibacterota bacterium]|nr:hypothetical protein [Candidatus Latescibacterota bacterium]